MILTLYYTLLTEAPETLLPPVRSQFISEYYYEQASRRYSTYGHWNS